MKSSLLKRQTAKGVLWNFAELMLRRGTAGITTLILAWFLTPEDFGLVAMMAVFLAFSDVLVDAGLSQALIRKPSVTSTEYDTAFIANIALAFIVYMVLFLIAPAIAGFYEASELEILIRVAGLAIVFTAFTVVQRAVLSRELKFKLQMKVSLPAAVLSGVAAILIAYQGFGVWALVAQILLQAVLTALFFWRLNLWRPHWQFSFKSLYDLSTFSGYLLFAHTTNVPFKHMYVVVIAKVFAAPIAGLYFFAEKIRDLLINQLVSSIQTVTYPALARVQENSQKLKKGYRQVIVVMTFLVFPVLIFVAVFVEPLFHLFLPEKWWQAGLYLQLMCLAALMNPLNAINLNILKVKGRSDLVFYLGLLKKALAIGIFAVTFRYGIIAILIGQILNSILAFVPNSYFSKQLIDYSVYEQLTDFIPGLLLAGGIGLAVWWLQDFLNWPELVELIVLCGTSVIIYLLGAWLLNLPALKIARDLLNESSEKASIDR